METIDDIVREMREGNPPCNYHKDNGESLDYEEMVMMFADRIEEALKRKAEATHSQWERAMMLETENKNLRAECESWRKQAFEEILDVAIADNDRLRAALKPVMECPVGYFWSSVNAVREAQRIYNERMARND